MDFTFRTGAILSRNETFFLCNEYIYVSPTIVEYVFLVNKSK